MRGPLRTICGLCITIWASSVPTAWTTLPQAQMPCINMPSSVNPPAASDNDNDGEEKDYEDDDNSDEDDEFVFKED